MARWLASFSKLGGIVVVDERMKRLYKRIRREIARSGIIGFIDVVAFRMYYKIVLSRRDKVWEKERLQDIISRYKDIPPNTPTLTTYSPNSLEAEEFIKNISPDIVIARCKTLLAKRIYSIPSKGTFVMHPGICPEYRNAHGCFWALASDDLENVGMTLLKVDEGIDTGPIYGYYTYKYDEINESHIIIQHRVVLDNLNEIESMLHEIVHDNINPLDKSGRKSAEWGQPWLTKYLRWKFNAKKRRR